MIEEKIKELLKKYRLEGKFLWTPETVISDLVRDYLPTLRIRVPVGSVVSKVISIDEFKNKISEFNRVIDFFDDIDGIEEQEEGLMDPFVIEAFKYCSIGVMLNYESGTNAFPRRCVKVPKRHKPFNYGKNE